MTNVVQQQRLTHKLSLEVKNSSLLCAAVLVSYKNRALNNPHCENISEWSQNNTSEGDCLL